MRRAVLLLVGQITSSRQSPNRSPESDGVDLVLLLECTSLPVSSRVSLDVPYLSMCVPSSSSRTGSASHQARKFVEPGLRPTFCPLVLKMPLTAEDQDSAPALPAHTSSETPRPLSQPQEAFCHRIFPVFASANQAAGESVCSSTLNTSSPGWDGSRSPTCSASPWPRPVFHSGAPLSLM